MKSPKNYFNISIGIDSISIWAWSPPFKMSYRNLVNWKTKKKWQWHFIASKLKTNDRIESSTRYSKLRFKECRFSISVPSIILSCRSMISFFVLLIFYFCCNIYIFFFFEIYCRPRGGPRSAAGRMPPTQRRPALPRRRPRNFRLKNKTKKN